MKRLLLLFVFISLGIPQSLGNKMVTILTEPSGAEVYLNGRSIGISPCTTRLKNGLITPKQMVKVEKDGYKTELFELNQKINPAIGCGGLCLGILSLPVLPVIGFTPLLWSTEFEDSYQIYLQPLEKNNQIKYNPKTGQLIQK